MNRPEKAIAKLSGPSQIGICETVKISAELSTGKLGRPLKYIWTQGDGNWISKREECFGKLESKTFFNSKSYINKYPLPSHFFVEFFQTFQNIIETLGTQRKAPENLA
jgi:hypothetical protein